MPHRKPLITVYGKPGCGLCAAAKAKLDLMGWTYDQRNISEATEATREWKKERMVEGVPLPVALRAFLAMNDEHLPIIEIADKLYTYPDAMKLLKGKG